MATDIFEMAKRAYICDINRPSVSSGNFSPILDWIFEKKCGRKYEYTREYYEKVAENADDIIIEAIQIKRSIERARKLAASENLNQDDNYLKIMQTRAQNNIKRVPPVIASRPLVFWDEFIEFIVGMKHYAGNPIKMDDLDKARKEWEEKQKEREADAVDADEIEEEKSSILDYLSDCISKVMKKWNI